jgi:hypothetical protein
MILQGGDIVRYKNTDALPIKERGENPMRDRLIELIGEFPIWHSSLKDRWMPEAVERLADHLLANGVIVPPCKVGDTVYCIWQYSDFAKTEPPFIKEAKVCSFVIDEGVAKIIPENYAEMADTWHRLMAVAFTKEEAEKALAERSEG